MLMTSDDTREAPETGQWLRVLLLEDSALDAELVQETLKDGGIDGEFLRVEKREEYQAALEGKAFDLILADYSLPMFDGTSALQMARAIDPEVPFIFVSGAIGEERAIESLKGGATDYVLKHRLERLVPAVHRALAEAEQRADRRRLALLLAQQAEELRLANEAKDQFLALLGHELRNQLSPLVNALHVMRLRNAGDPAFERAREISERQLRHMSRLINDLLDISRISQGKIDLQRERLALATLLEQAAEAARPLMEERGHQFAVSPGPEPLWLEADATRLQQVLMNLLSNAAKYTDPGGSISLVAERTGDEVVIRVRDTGRGIPKPMLARVFDLFQQVDPAADPSLGGLGLGLNLVKRLVERHGGTVHARSEGPGSGSEFIVRLPAAPGP